MERFRQWNAKLYYYVKQIGFWKGVFLFLLMSYVAVLPLGVVEWALGFFGSSLGDANILPYSYVKGDVISRGMFRLFVTAVFAPVVETVISQVIPIRIMLRIPWLKNRPGHIILIAGLLFGLMHTYHLGYVLFAFFVGLVLAYMYYLYYTRYEEEGDSVPPEKKIPPFWPVCVVHALRNGIAVIIVLASGM